MVLSRDKISRLFRFGVTGVLAAGVDMGVLHLGTSLLGLNLYWGRLLSYLIAASFAWYLNRRITFTDRRDQSVFGEWLKYLVANSLGGAINYSVYAVLVSSMDVFYQHPYLAVGVGSLAGLAANFTMSQQFVFGRR